MEALRSRGKQTFDERCRYKENGEVCGRPLSGTAWRYCDLHREAGQRQAKRQRDKKKKADYRKRNRLEDNFYHVLYYHHLTEPQLKPLVERAKSLQEQYPSSKDDRHQFAHDQLIEIKQPLLSPPSDLPSAAHTAAEQLVDVLKFLEAYQASSPNFVTAQLLAYGKELWRDIGMWMSPEAFPLIGREAKAVRKMWRERGELLHLAHALFVETELCRQKFLAKPYRRGFLDKADTWLSAAEYVCGRYTGEQKHLAGFLRFYVYMGKVRLVFDDGKPEQAANNMKVLQERANAVVDAYGTGPVVEATLFLSSLAQAEYHLRRKNTDCASHHLKNAKQAFSTMEWRSIEAEKGVAFLKVVLDLESTGQMQHEDWQDYIDLFHRHPTFEHRRNLRQLKQLYPRAVPDVPSLKGASLYVETMFRHLHPIMFLV